MIKYTNNNGIETVISLEDLSIINNTAKKLVFNNNMVKYIKLTEELTLTEKELDYVKTFDDPHYHHAHDDVDEDEFIYTGLRYGCDIGISDILYFNDSYYPSR